MLAILLVVMLVTASAMVQTCPSGLKTILVFGGTGQLGRECVYQVIATNR